MRQSFVKFPKHEVQTVSMNIWRGFRLSMLALEKVAQEIRANVFGKK